MFLIFQRFILNNLVVKIGDSFSITDPKGYMDNLVKTEIFYEQFTYESIHQRPKYKVWLHSNL